MAEPERPATAEASQEGTVLFPEPAHPTTAEASQEETVLFPELYVSTNAFQRMLSLRVLDLDFERPSDASKQFLDVGCGTGRFTRHELLPRCQPCARIVATDHSERMVSYARENFAHPQVEYVVHDISKDVSGLVEEYGKFDRVYSFFALHLVKDQTTALRNVSDLMVTGGECLLLFVGRWTGFDLWRRVVQMESWKSYAEICEQYIPSSHDLDDHDSLISYVTEILKNVNLKTRTCKILKKVCVDEDAHRTIVVNTAAIPVLPLLPKTSRKNFEDDLANVIRAFWTEKKEGDLQYYTDLFVIYASKL